MEKQLKRNRSYWSKEEDEKLWSEVFTNRNRNSWRSVARNAGLNRSGNACRLRWFNHLKPGYRPGRLTDEEKLLTLEFRSRLGKNCWAKIARQLLPGRRDNDIKNFWHTMAKRAKLENGDVDSKAEVKKAELVEKITAAGKLTMGTSLISPNAYYILSMLLPDLAAAADTGGADALISADVGPNMDSQIFSIQCGSDVDSTWAPGGGSIFGIQPGGGGVNEGCASNDTGNPHNSYTGVDGGV